MGKAKAKRLEIGSNWFKKENSPKTFYLELLSAKQKRAGKFRRNTTNK